MQPYTAGFFREAQEGSLRSAREVVPLAMELIRPRSVIDVGCGLGSWLAVFKQYGVDDIWGIDGSYVDKDSLQIPPERFLSFDLAKPFRLEREFDLVVSLEVAEHLPKQCAEGFVHALTNLGPVVLFSAAIPHQGGTHHVNEQWPDYWARLFHALEYCAIDCLRKKIWQNTGVEWWYAQNVLIFARSAQLSRLPLLAKEVERAGSFPLSIVHPECFLAAADPAKQPLRRVLAALPEATMRAVANRAKRLFPNKWRSA